MADLYPQAAGGAHKSGIERLREIAQMLWDGKWIVLATLATVLGCVAAYTYTQTPVYRTSSTVMITRDQTVVPGVSTTGRQVLSQLSSTLEGEGGLQSQVFAINRSQEIRRIAARRIDSIETNPNTGKPARILYDQSGERRDIASLTAALRGGVSAQPSGGQVNAITLTVSSTSAEEAAFLANQYAKAYSEWTERQNQKATQSSVEFLRKQTKRYQEEVQQAEKRLEEFMREEGGVQLDQRTSRAVDKVASLRSRREELQVELDMKKARLESRRQELARIRPKLAERLSSGVGAELARVQKEKAEVIAQIKQAQNRSLGQSERPTRALAELQSRREKLQREADSLARTYVEETISVDGIGSTFSDPVEGRSGGRGRGLAYISKKQEQIAQLRIEVSGLEAKIQTVSEQIADYESRLDTLPARQMRLTQIQRDRRAAEEIYGFVRQKLQEMRIAEESEGAFAQLTEPAPVPASPVSPKSSRNMKLAALLGLLLGGGLVLLRDRLDTRIRVPGDLKALGPQMIGVIPSMENLIKSEFDGEETVEIDGQALKTDAIMLTSPGSAPAEAFRQLRINLRYVRPDAPIGTLVVTSPKENEGKTTTAFNLAVASARSGDRVALIDADLRRPQLHSYLNVPRSPGLTEALYDEATFTPTGIDNLVMLPAGESVPNPSEVLGSRRMKSLLDTVAGEVDLVVLDTPPTLPFSDSTAVLPHTDGSLLIAQAGVTDGRAFERAQEKLGGVGPGVIGSVLNRFDVEEGGYGYYYGDLYHYEDYGHEETGRRAEEKRKAPSGA